MYEPESDTADFRRKLVSRKLNGLTFVDRIGQAEKGMAVVYELFPLLKPYVAAEYTNDESQASYRYQMSRLRGRFRLTINAGQLLLVDGALVPNRPSDVVGAIAACFPLNAVAARHDPGWKKFKALLLDHLGEAPAMPRMLSPAAQRVITKRLSAGALVNFNALRAEALASHLLGPSISPLIKALGEYMVEMTMSARTHDEFADLLSEKHVVHVAPGVGFERIDGDDAVIDASEDPDYYLTTGSRTLLYSGGEVFIAEAEDGTDSGLTSLGFAKSVAMGEELLTVFEDDESLTFDRVGVIRAAYRRIDLLDDIAKFIKNGERLSNFRPGIPFEIARFEAARVDAMFDRDSFVSNLALNPNSVLVASCQRVGDVVRLQELKDQSASPDIVIEDRLGRRVIVSPGSVALLMPNGKKMRAVAVETFCNVLESELTIGYEPQTLHIGMDAKIVLEGVRCIETVDPILLAPGERSRYQVGNTRLHDTSDLMDSANWSDRAGREVLRAMTVSPTPLVPMKQPSTDLTI